MKKTQKIVLSSNVWGSVRVYFIVCIACFLLLTFGNVEAKDAFKECFSISYGPGKNQVLVEQNPEIDTLVYGPHRLLTDASGNFYIDDWLNRKVLIVRRDGSFVNSVEYPEGKNPKVSVDWNGDVYFYYFDRVNGKIVRSSYVYEQDKTRFIGFIPFERVSNGVIYWGKKNAEYKVKEVEKKEFLNNDIRQDQPDEDEMLGPEFDGNCHFRYKKFKFSVKCDGGLLKHTAVIGVTGKKGYFLIDYWDKWHCVKSIIVEVVQGNEVPTRIMSVESDYLSPRHGWNPRFIVDVNGNLYGLFCYKDKAFLKVLKN
jgi:hypothetical protein